MTKASKIFKNASYSVKGLSAAATYKDGDNAYSVIAGEVKDPIEVTPDHLLEADICYHVTLLTDLLEESRIAAAAGNLPICGAWTGWNTVVRVKDFFTWAEIEGYFVPEAI